MAKLLDRCAEIYSLGLDRHLAGIIHDDEIDTLVKETRQAFRQMDQLLNAGWNEPGGRDSYASLTQTMRGILVLFRHIQSMDAASRKVPPRSPDEPMLAPLRDLEVTTKGAMSAAADAIRERKRIPVNPLLRAALTTAEQRLEERRENRTPPFRSIDAVLHLYAIFYSMRTIAESLIHGLRDE